MRNRNLNAKEIKTTFIRGHIQQIQQKDVFCNFKKMMLHYGLVDIQSIDSSIVVEIKYATEDNFTGKSIYQCLKRAFLQKEIALQLSECQKFLKKLYPMYSLIVYDAARPLIIQRILWEETDLPPFKKSVYLSNPSKGSVHNYGCAVDVSILDENKHEVDMGSSYDFFGELSQPSKENFLLAQGKLTKTQIENRNLLRTVMWHGGFHPIPGEWWHFNALTRTIASQKYKLIE